MTNKFFILIIICSMLACNATKNIQQQTLKNIDKQGHRGCRGLMPENTISAMFKAIDAGVNTLEMDVVFTKDAVAIVSHEPFFNHEITTLPNGQFVDEAKEKNYNIFKMTFAETQRYDVGLKPHPRFAQQQKLATTKPALASLIDSVEAYTEQKKLPSVYYNIETKTTPATDNIFHPAPAVFVAQLMKVIINKHIETRVIIQSFDRRTLQYLHQHYPTIKTALLVEAFDKNSFRKQIKDLGFTPTIYSPEQALVNENLIAACHKAGIKIIPWTINDKATIQQFIKLGVDGIITDYPNLFNEIKN